MAKTKYIEKLSYSKTNVMENCPYKYKIQYIDKHFVYNDTLATLLGTLIHHIEEEIGLALKDGVIPDYDKLKKDLYEINIPKTTPTDPDGGIFGVNILKEKYRDEYYSVNENGESYHTLIQKYAESGIYRLQNFLTKFPDWTVFAVEQYFEVDYYCQPTGKHYTLHGYIDRILKNTKTGEFMIEDLKTRSKLFPDEDLKSPMQFFFYSYALKSMQRLFDYPEHCRYDLVLMDERQAGGTKGWIGRCQKKLDKILMDIEQKAFVPNPSPLCYYCAFSGTNPDRHNLDPKDRHLCPYYSLWTKGGTAKVWEVENKWEGFDKHDVILARYKAEQTSDTNGHIDIDLDAEFDFDY